MNLLEKIKDLCKNQGISLSALEKELELGQYSISKWETSSPKAVNLQKIADYFDVSTDYLLGRAENTPPKEFDFVEYLHTLTWENLTPEQKKEMVRLVYGAEVEKLEKEDKEKK